MNYSKLIGSAEIASLLNVTQRTVQNRSFQRRNDMPKPKLYGKTWMWDRDRLSLWMWKTRVAQVREHKRQHTDKYKLFVNVG